MFPFDPPENIRKPNVFCFQGDQKGTLGTNGLICPRHPDQNKSFAPF